MKVTLRIRYESRGQDCGQTLTYGTGRPDEFAAAVYQSDVFAHTHTTPCHVRARSRAWRTVWLRYHHQDRLRWHLARNGKFGLCEAACDSFHRCERMLDLPSTKGYEP